MATYRTGDKFVVSGDYAERGSAPVMAERQPSAGRGGYWIVIGPRVLRGGRVDLRQRAHYGTIHDDGKINNYGGSGTAGRHYRTYLEIARDKLAGEAGGVGHVVRGPEPVPAPEPPPPGTGGVLTIVDKPAVRGVTIRRLEAAGIRCQVGRSPIPGTVVLHVDANRGREAWRISRDVEREWLDAKHQPAGKGRSPRGLTREQALAALGAAIRRAKGGYSQEIHEAQDACYDDARIPSDEVDAFEDRVRHGLLASRNPAVRRTTREFVNQQADLRARIERAQAASKERHRGGKGRGPTRYPTTKKPGDPTYSAAWSGVTGAPRARGLACPRCGGAVHREGDSLYCPRCDDYVTAVRRGGKRRDVGALAAAVRKLTR